MASGSESGAQEEQVFLCAYGMGRGTVGREPARGYRVMDSVATFFQYDERLVPNELVLRRLNDFLSASPPSSAA